MAVGSKPQPLSSVIRLNLTLLSHHRVASAARPSLDPIDLLAYVVEVTGIARTEVASIPWRTS